MLTLNELKSHATKLKEISLKVAQLADLERSQLKAIAEDRSRSQEWKAAESKRVRNETRPVLEKAQSGMRDLMAEVEDARPYYENELLALSREPFFPAAAGASPTAAADARQDNAAKDATIRARLVADLQAMPLGAAQLWAVQAAQSREWAKVYSACLALGERLPFALGSLPIPSIEAADEAIYQCEVAMAEATISAEELAGRQTSTRQIALGLMHQRHQQAVLLRQRGIQLTAEERAKMGVTGPQSITEMMAPTPLGTIDPVEATAAR